MARQDRLGTQSGNCLRRLNARALRGVEILCIVVSGELAGIGVHQDKMLGSAEPWIDSALQTRSFRSDDDFHGMTLMVFSWHVLSLPLLVLSGIDLFLKRSVDEEPAFPAALIVAVFGAAAVSVVSPVVDQEAEIATAMRKRMIGYCWRRITLTVSLVHIVAAVVQEHSQLGCARRVVNATYILRHRPRAHSLRDRPDDPVRPGKMPWPCNTYGGLAPGMNGDVGIFDINFKNLSSEPGTSRLHSSGLHTSSRTVKLS